MLFVAILFSTIVKVSHALPAPTSSIIVLPVPTGSYQVGRSVSELVDYGHTQPFAPDVEPRKLMISVFYPVEKSKGPPALAEYFPSITANFEDVEFVESWDVPTPDGTFEKLRLQLANPEQSWAGSHNEDERTFPVVLFTPAEGTTRLFYSLIASTISSKGYTVVTIDTAYDLDIVQYTDNTIATLNLTVVNDTNQTQVFLDAALAVQTRAQDASFVLDNLANTTFAQSLIPRLPPSGLNTSHVTMFGHSLGRAATLTAMTQDTRIIGGMNMDGAFFGTAIKTGTTKPFMIMAAENHTRNLEHLAVDPENSWALTWPNLKGWRRDVMVRGAKHYDFSDQPVVFDTLGLVLSEETKEKTLIGDLEGKRALQIVTTYMGAFAAFVMYGTPSSLLDATVDDFPEIVFQY